MTRDEFLAALRGHFGLAEHDGVLPAEGITIDSPEDYGWEYGDDNRPKALKTSRREAKRRLRRLGSFYAEPVEIDADFHFAAAIIADDNGEEYVHVAEPGPYFDHVFLNLHDEGLSTVEDLMDADIDPTILVAVHSSDAYVDVSKQTRIEWMPFFQNPIARSLQELHDRLVRKAGTPELPPKKAKSTLAKPKAKPTPKKPKSKKPTPKKPKSKKPKSRKPKSRKPKSKSARSR